MTRRASRGSYIQSGWRLFCCGGDLLIAFLSPVVPGRAVASHKHLCMQA